MKKASSSGKARLNSKAGKITSIKKTAEKRRRGKGPPNSRARCQRFPRTGSLQQRIAAAKRIEALDRPKAEPKSAKRKSPAVARSVLATAIPSHSQRNSDFPNTYIQTISVRLEDPNHPVTLTWSGPNASAQETGPFRSSPGAGLRGLNCDIVATSRRSGSNCTPKGTFTVTGFAPHLTAIPRRQMSLGFSRRAASRCTFIHLCRLSRRRMAVSGSRPSGSRNSSRTTRAQALRASLWMGRGPSPHSSIEAAIRNIPPSSVR